VLLHAIRASAVLLLIILRPGGAVAQERRIPVRPLEWRAPAGCPSQAWLETEVQRLSEAEPADRGSIRISIAAVVSQDPRGRWHVAVSTTEGGYSGVRELDAGTCLELANSTALLIGLMIRATDSDPSPSAPSIDRAPQAARPKPAAPATQRAEARVARSRTRWFAGPSLAAHAGILPGISAAVGADAGAHVGETRLAVSALYFPSRRAGAAENAIAQGRFRLLNVGISVCRKLARGVSSAGLCVSADWQRLTGDGISQSVALKPVQRTADFFTVGGGGFLRFYLSRRFCLPLKIEAMVPTRRPEFTFIEAVVLRPAAVFARLSLTLELALL
jgi:hypothetical protein